MGDKKKKSRIWTYFLSFIPGAGFMYRRFMKRGFSYLTVFFTSIYIHSILQLSILSVIPILIWFYAFFDQLNTFSLSEQEFVEVKDEIILIKQIKLLDFERMIKNRKIFGGLFIVTGSYLFIRSIYYGCMTFLPRFLRNILQSWISYTPQLLLAAGILYGGICLLQGRTKLLEEILKNHKIHGQQNHLQEQIAQTNVVYYIDKDIPMNKVELSKIPETDRIDIQ